MSSTVLNIKKMFHEYKKNLIDYRDLQYNVILQSRADTLGVHTLAISDPVYRSVEKIEKLGKELKLKIKVVEICEEHFKGTQNWKAIQLRCFKHHSPDVVSDFMGCSRTQVFNLVREVYKYAEKVVEEECRK